MTNLLYRERTKNEATGVRIVSQFSQEFWECGWQEFDQRNDKGIDGIIILRKKGVDLGVNINVQIKCGKGYISSETKEEIRISINDPIKLIEHIKYWKNQNEPEILVYVNPYILDKNKKWRENRLNAKAWWVDLKSNDLQPEETMTLISIPKKQTFGEHSKGDIINLAKKIIENKNYQKIIANESALKMYSSSQVKEKARAFFKEWKINHMTFCNALNTEVIISKIAWRHILQQRRGIDRQTQSLRLLGIAKQLIEEADEYFILSREEDEFEITEHIGIRALTEIKNAGNSVIQVILLRKTKKESKRKKTWFYSVHHRN